jgi:hypothetical protein
MVRRNRHLPTPARYGGACAHEGFHSGRSRISREHDRLRYVIVCDDCLAELREVAAVEYRPRFEPSRR